MCMLMSLVLLNMEKYQFHSWFLKDSNPLTYLLLADPHTIHMVIHRYLELYNCHNRLSMFHHPHSTYLDNQLLKCYYNNLEIDKSVQMYSILHLRKYMFAHQCKLMIDKLHYSNN